VKLVQIWAPWLGPRRQRFPFQRSRERSQLLDVTLSGQGNLKYSLTTLRPGSFELVKRALGIGPEPHPRMNDNVVEVTVTVEIERQ